MSLQPSALTEKSALILCHWGYSLGHLTQVLSPYMNLLDSSVFRQPAKLHSNLSLLQGIHGEKLGGTVREG